MPEYAWRAASRDGKIEQGRLSAPSQSLALSVLRSQGLTPLHIYIADGRHATDYDATREPGRRVRRERARTAGGIGEADVRALTSELAIMLRAGLSLDNALRVLVEMAHKPSVKLLVQNILDAVKGGAPFSRALAGDHDLFGDFYINMVRSGEVSGQMSSVLDRLVEHLEQQRALRDGVVSATIYPAILLGAAILSLVVMLGFVVPQFEKLFNEMGDALPLPTRIVMELGRLFRTDGLVILSAIAIVVFVLVRWLRSPNGQQKWQASLLRLPLFGKLVLRYQLTLFSRSLGTLLANGVPMLAALNIAVETVGNKSVQKKLAGISPSVKEGGKMAQAAAVTGVFEPLAISLIRVGEETGRIGSMMLELSNILNREVEIGVKRLLTLLEPMLILILGILVAAIIVSILLGILSINDLAA